MFNIDSAKSISSLNNSTGSFIDTLCFFYFWWPYFSFLALSLGPMIWLIVFESWTVLKTGVEMFVVSMNEKFFSKFNCLLLFS